MANEYLTLDELKATRELTGRSFADQDLELALAAASRGVDGICGRRFWIDPGTVVRYYTRRNSEVVLIDDLVTMGSLVADGVTLTRDTDFVLEPMNAAADGRPFTTVTALTRAWPTKVGSVKIGGIWGWPTVPDQIKQATGILASRLLLRHREAPFGVVFSGADLGVATRIARSDPDVGFLTDPFVEGVLVA